MKKMAVLCAIILVFLGCVPAMAEMMELTDSEMELITGQASEIGVLQQFTGVDDSAVQNFYHLDTLNMDTLATNFDVAEIELARTVITVDSLSTQTLLGPVEVRGITVDMEPGTTIRFF